MQDPTLILSFTAGSSRVQLLWGKVGFLIPLSERSFQH
jgi:hypothetical protein